MARHVATFPFLRAFAVACLVGLVSVASGQVINVSNINLVSVPTPGSGHNYVKLLNETVNPANGSLSLRVEAPVAQQRGDVNFPFYVFGYDSGGVSQPAARVSWGSVGGFVQPALNIFWTDSSHITGLSVPDAVGLIPGGFVANTGIAQTFFQQSSLNVQISSSPLLFATCSFNSGYVYIDPFANRHSMNVGWITASGTAGGDEGCSGAGVSGFNTGWSDGEYSMTLTGTAQTPNVTSYVGDEHGRHQGAEDTNGNCCGATGVTTVANSQIASVAIAGLANPYAFGYSTANRNYTADSTLLTSFSTAGCPTSLPAQVWSLKAMQTITLPNSTVSNPQKYTFGYDPTYGLLNSIKYPTGGSVTYTWGANLHSESLALGGSGYMSKVCWYQHGWPAIQKRNVSFDGTHQALEQDFAYTTTWGTGSGANQWTQKTTTVTTKDCARASSCSVAPSFQTVYTYRSAPVCCSLFSGQSPVESTVVYKDFNGSVLKTVTKNWNLSSPPQLLSECVTLPSGPTAGAFYAYAGFNLVSDKKEYDYGILASNACAQGASSPASTATRETVITYQSFPPTPFPGTSMSDRPSTVKVYGNGTLLAETDYAYDQTSVATVSPTAVSHDETNFSPSNNNRGNATTKTVRCFVGATNCPNSVIKYAYDETGQVLTMTDPKLNVTQFSYVDSYTSGGTPPGNTNAHVTRITYPPTSGASHVENFSYDYANGQLTVSKDQNGQPTTYKYQDPFARLTEIDYPDSGQTLLSYNDTAPNPSMTTCKLINGAPGATCSAASPPAGWMVTLGSMDGLGHVIHTQLNSDPDGVDTTDTTYDGLERVFTRSNPHRAASSPTDGTTTYLYDALGRTKQVTQPDSSTVITSYTGRAADTMDEGNGNGTRKIERVFQTDGFGRLVSVCEVTSSTQLGTGGTPGACGQDIAKTGFLTSYAYDALGNLLSVNQGSLSPRTFSYNSLSRLLCAANPEIASVTCPNPDNGSYTAGTIRYSYDANGNLATKIAPKPNQSNTSVTVTTTYGYDALNRTTGISYNDGSTPSVTNQYDQSSEIGAVNDVGRRTYASVSSGSTVLYKRSLVTYDKMGRLQLEYQCAPDTCALDRYNVGYAYDLIGDEKTVTAGFPAAGSQTQTNLYTSAGRLQKASTTLAQFAVLDSLHYTPLGAPASASVGPSMAESWSYNNRGRIASIAAAGPGSGGLQNFYTESLLYAPNGDVTTLNDSVNGNWLNTYDDFNRLSTAVASNAGEGCSFGYDRYGNRWQESPSSGSCNSRPLSFTTNNRIVGYSYDAAGNELNDGTHTYTYDAENRILSVDGSTAYVYDADGRRVGKKATGVFVAEYILHQDGRQLAQLGVGGNLVRGEVYAGGRHVATYNGQGLYFTFPDHLGTERIRRNADGSALETCTNLPFGDGQQCSGTDVSALHLTGKERDTESGLDMFGARYYGSSLGRFMTPDWAASPTGVPYADFGNPQSLNLYGYVKNNPATLTDPNGHCWSWVQSVCNTVQIAANYWAGNGAKTNTEVAHGTAEYNRNWYVNHAGGNREQFAKMSDTQVNDFDKAYQNGASSFTSEGQKFVITAATAIGRFATDAQLQGHFGDHGRDFGAKTPGEYQQQADTFLNGPRASGVLEKVRPNGDIVRYNPATEEFGVAQGNGTIRTYFKPDPSIHGYATNLDYFNAQ